uniref:Scavenger receptor class F member 2 n=1 Tax=Magallana gigas TaxID=29159 RepID=A0A8W8NWF6_MAGGI|nr:uncharacterized protein LOC105335102 [Crassostrea gigas]
MAVQVCGFWMYGQNCSQKCGNCKVNITCDSTGLCTSGCQLGWKGSKCLEAVELKPYPLSTLLLSGFLAVTLVLLLLVSVELHRQIQSKNKTRRRSYELPGKQLIEKESDNRYIPLENYQQIPDQLENITQSLDDSDDGSHRDSSHYTIPNMTYAGNSNYEKDWTSPKH